MKTRFSTLDICAALSEIQAKAVGLRLVNVYDLDNKTYIFKLSKTDVKLMLLIESGIRIHLSEFDWPKNNIPSGFSMKLRKHLRGRRLVSATQLGSDRIVDLQFGSDEAAFHVILELYDRGNIALTDHEDIILTLLRFRKNPTGESKNEENADVRCAVHEQYPRQAARPVEPLIPADRLRDVLKEAKVDAVVKRFLIPLLPYGAACIDHCLSVGGFPGNVKLGKDFNLERDLEALHKALEGAEGFMDEAKSGKCKGFIVQKKEKKSDGELLTNVEFHPFLFGQYKQQPVKEFPSFNQAVDEFYSSLESQKNDLKVLQRERAAFRKLENVRKDHDSRLLGLRSEQEEDKKKASIIEDNLELVDQAIRVICSAIANQVDWNEIKTLVLDAQARGDVVATAIKSLKLETNSMVMSLNETSTESDDSLDSDSEREFEEPEVKSQVKKKPIKVEIDLALSAYANAQKYYNKKRSAAHKEQRTIDASQKAFKSAEKKTLQTLKEATIISNIQKARKTFWFEKFLWFISSENFLVLGGRDAQQNEILVKKYLKAGDVYVHADLHGATSCIVKNNTGQPVPPKTLNEAGTMAICHSAAWDSKVVTSAWWVHHDQVSKTAPTGEYLTTGSFLVRGKKNFLPPSYLIYGFGFLFKVDETCIWKHRGERKVRMIEDDLSSAANTAAELEEIVLTSEDECDPIIESHALQSHDIEVVETLTKTLDAVEIAVGEIAQDGDRKVDGSSSSEDEDATAFPDTQVKVVYNVSSKYQLDSIDQGKNEEDENRIFLGDDNPVILNQQKKDDVRCGKARLSAKQKREQKKLQKANRSGAIEESDVPPPTILANGNEPAAAKKMQSEPQQPYVRGQKKKMAKLRRKNYHEEDEDKKMMQEMLRAAKPVKDKKKKGKNKKDDEKQPPQRKEANVQKQQKQKSASAKTGKRPEAEKLDSDEERELLLKEEHLNLEEMNNALDSLTGQPTDDDILLFAIPICAPYNTMQNYKFKVKLTPGTGKKGKAAKTAINMFQATRDVTAQEKNHFRSVKDNDLSRNMPGKVKVSAPNLQKLKSKKR